MKKSINSRRSNKYENSLAIPFNVSRKKTANYSDKFYRDPLDEKDDEFAHYLFNPDDYDWTDGDEDSMRLMAETKFFYSVIFFKNHPLRPFIAECIKNKTCVRGSDGTKIFEKYLEWYSDEIKNK